MKTIIKNIILANKDYNLIEDQDIIGVGISGGKDSLLLLYALNTYKIVIKKTLNKDIKIIGIHINMGFNNMNFDKIDQFCLKNNIELKHFNSKIYNILLLNKKNNKLQCSLCSTLIKGAVVNYCKKLNCNKIAYGHHLDDAIETLFMNMIYGARIATFQPKMYLSDQDITFIRPFIYINEEQIIQVINNIKIPVVESTCPNDKNTQRTHIKNKLNKFYHEYPMAKKNFKKMLYNKKQVSLWGDILPPPTLKLRGGGFLFE